jgi:hypothetical protein
LEAGDISLAAFNALRRQAEEGKAEAQVELATLYLLGDEVPQHYGEAMRWFRKAADQNNTLAQYRIGQMYARGDGVAASPVESYRWIQKAGAQGYPRAQIALALLHLEGRGTVRNPVEALRWIQRAAHQGDSEGQRWLARFHAEGTVVRRDLVEAYKWNLLAAAGGDTEAAVERDRLARLLPARSVEEAQKRAAGFVPRSEPGAHPEARSSGTAFFVTPEGLLLTAHHVVERATRLVVRHQGTNYLAKVMRADTTNDIALLQITGVMAVTATNPSSLGLARTPGVASGSTNAAGGFAGRFHALALGDSTTVKLGDRVSTLGFPNPTLQGHEAKFTRGEINSLTGFRDSPRHFQLSAPVQPGNSGGPAFDQSGNVIGMMVMTLNQLAVLRATGSLPQNVNYALKSELLREFARGQPGVAQQLAKATPPGDSGGDSAWLPSASDAVAFVLAY